MPATCALLCEARRTEGAATSSIPREDTWVKADLLSRDERDTVACADSRGNRARVPGLCGQQKDIPMKTLLTCTALAGLALAMAVPAAMAQDGYRGLRRPAPGEIILNQTERAQHEPGVTQELAPDAKQTATGGPSGGVPGFSR